MSRLKIGIVGGGQLAALLVDEARRHDTACYVLDPDPQCPASLSGAKVIEGNVHDVDSVARLASLADVLTVEIEDVNVAALSELEQQGHTIYPRPATLQLLTNKLRQKQTMQSAGIPTSRFQAYDGINPEGLSLFGWPVVQKAAEGGYDGRGVAIIRDIEDIDGRLRVPGFIEAYVPHAAELSVMVARDASGNTTVWAPVEMTFDQRGNLLTYLIAPARVSERIASLACELAVQTVEVFDGIGIFGVEMFLTPEDELLINEVAPRTHNSGHYTIDACSTSQFLQQYHILMNEPLGSTLQSKPAVMFNLLGAEGFDGRTLVEGDQPFRDSSGVHIYLYGKQRCFPLRKMGHVTVTADTIEAAIELAEVARRQIIVRGEEQI